MTEKWKERARRAVDNARASGESVFGSDVAFRALIDALHEKGILSDDDESFLLKLWDEVDEIPWPEEQEDW
jgi:hypothetical protein